MSDDKTTRTTERQRIAFAAWPEVGCLTCVIEYEKRTGPVGRSNGNSAVGWIVTQNGRTVSPTLGSLREAKQWAEERYDVVGWQQPGSAPYHATPAVPNPKTAIVNRWLFEELLTEEVMKARN